MWPGVIRRLAAPPRGEVFARLAVAVFFVWLTARFWHPCFGFTRLLQFNEPAAAVMLPSLRHEPIFFYPGGNGYDGQYYAQLAAAPALTDPALSQALDGPAYRARRILLSWTAWALGGGDPGRAVQIYAVLNIALWFWLAAILWRALPPGDWRATLAWSGVLLSAGVLFSVRLALTDLLALVLLLLAWGRVEKDRLIAAGVCLGLAALARETALLGAVMLLADIRRDGRRLGAAAVATVLPLGLWMAYVSWRLGSGEPGLNNFTWPLQGWLEKWRLSLPDLASDTYRWLATTTVLAHLALTVQAVWLLWRRDWRQAVWRLGAGFAGLMALLGLAVWEGHPGAATRVLLPLTAAFNILAVRRRAGWGWLAAGNLGVFAGVLALWQVPQLPDELGAGRFAGGAWTATLEREWYGRENTRRHIWAWSAQGGMIDLRCWSKKDGPVDLRCGLRAASRRAVEIRQQGRVLWRGEVGERTQPLVVRGIVFADGRAAVEFATAAPPIFLGSDARPLGLAVYDVALSGVR